MSEAGTLQRALGAIDRAFAAKTQAELDDIFAAEFAVLGFPVFVAGRIVDAQGKLAATPYFGRGKESWIARYMEQQHYRHDSMLRLPLTSPLPQRWKEASKRPDLSHEERQLFEEAADFGLIDGIVTPLHHGDGSVSGVAVMADAACEPSEAEQAAVHLLSLYYCCFGLRLAQEGQPQARHLTPRQRECLQWVHNGKTSAEISDILGISERTVNFHLAEACRAFSVRNRRQAVVHALIEGAINL